MEKNTIRATVETSWKDGKSDCLSYFSAQKALIGALTLVTSEGLRVQLADITVYSGGKCIFHKAFKN